jgi:NAD(P)-dependent dehydrogenase (short-subunit alcohol dehydrogenase family)
MGKLEGKIALITGGNSGIGLATAKAFVNEGAYVFVTGRRGPELAAAVEEIGKNASGIQGDMAKLADLDRLYAKIKQDKGRLDIVFANAGVAKYAALGDITEELYDATFGVNGLSQIGLDRGHHAHRQLICRAKISSRVRS